MTTETAIFLETEALAAPTPQSVKALAAQFARAAVERDTVGDTPLAERDASRRSGLLSLTIPKCYGGHGASWAETLDIVREFAQVDSSTACVYDFHHLLLATVRLFAWPDQWEPWYEQIARKHWLWGNALNPLDDRTIVRRFGGWYEFSGKRSLCSGALDSQMLIALSIDEHSHKLLVAAAPTARAGITLNHGWNAFGQRQTGSDSALSEKVRVEENELLCDPGPLTTPFSSLRPLLTQLVLVHLFLGLAEGAFEQARHYTLHGARPWYRSAAKHTSEDPYTLAHYGELFVGLESVRLLTRQTATRFDEAWAHGPTLTAHARGHISVAVATAKVAATRVGLDLTSRMFETTGARATHGALALDRFRRNLHTQMLHDPVDYELHELGDWALNSTLPEPSFYP